jgi:hypothetical protein
MLTSQASYPTFENIRENLLNLGKASTMQIKVGPLGKFVATLRCPCCSQVRLAESRPDGVVKREPGHVAQIDYISTICSRLRLETELPPRRRNV